MPSPDLVQLAQVIIVKILPLYAVMALGFLLGRMHKKAAEPLSFLQIYFISPVVVASSLANLNFQKNYLLLPGITFVFSSLVCLIAYKIGKRIWKDNTANIFAYACSNGNTGYFGVPVALIIFPAETLGLFMMASVGFTLVENSLGYYLIARGNFTIRDSLRKLLRLPTLYAFVIGVTLSVLGQSVPAFARDIVRDFRGCYVVLGALMIGLGLSRLEHLKIEGKLLAFVVGLKFIFWPLLAMGLIAMDQTLFHYFTAEVHKIILLLSIMPLPANAIAFAMQLNVQPEKTSTLVFLSTLFALFYIPLVMALWG